MAKEAYKHDFSGSWKPVGGYPILGSQKTFSVGIFQWVPKSSGKGLKKTAVKYRVKGRLSQEDAVYARAKEVCSAMNTGTWESTKKSETV